jgi:anti-anti-sigma factor
MILQSLPARSGWRLFKIEGQLDFTSAPTVRMALAHVAERDRSNVLVDLEDVKSVDDKGLAALTGALRRLRNGDPPRYVALVARQRTLAESLSRGDLPPDIPIYRSGREALRSIAA